MLNINVIKGIKMKKFLAIAALFVTLNFTGCYTIVWTPEDNFPTESTGNYEEQYYNEYYSPDYYGPYYSYYNYPWWLSIDAASINQTVKKDVKRDSNETGRNEDGGRGSSGSRGTIIGTPPVTKNEPGTGGTTTPPQSSGSGSGTTTTTQTRSSSSDSSKRTDPANTRNSDGGRSTDKGRK